MKVFVTGATGTVGTAVLKELIGNGHSVTGLARSDRSAEALRAAGAKPLAGSLEDFEVLKSAARDADGIIHLAFNHDFSKFAEAGRLEKDVIALFGAALAGSKRPFIATSGVAMAAPGRVATENDIRTGSSPIPRDSETPTLELAKKCVHPMIVRLSVTTHGDGKGGFAGILSDLARAKGQSAYIGRGENRWPAVHRDDAANLYRLALEKGAAGSIYHAVAETGLCTRDIAEAIGQALGVPTRAVSDAEAEAHFGGFKTFATFDTPASSDLTRERLGWKPTGIGLIEDLRRNLKR